MIWLLFLAVMLLLCGWWSLRHGTRLNRQAGLPQGRLVYADQHHQNWQPLTQPLYSATYRLSGKPDYVVETSQGLIPVEIKSGSTPQVPYLGHLLQLAAYCLLIEETKGQAPPHGLLKYEDALYEVDFTSELRSELLTTMAEMRQAWQAKEIARSHNQAGKCARCGFRNTCGMTLDGEGF